MSPSNKRNLAILGSVVLIGLCVAAFFIGKHAGSRQASLPAAPASAVSPSSPPSSPSVRTSASPSPSPSAAAPAGVLATTPATTASSTLATDAAASAGPSTTIPVHISVPLSTVGESPAVLLPTSCTLTGGVATASGTFNPDAYAESYVRVGDVVELYVYSGPGAVDPTGTQLADLGAERPVPVDRTGPWQVTVPLVALGPSAAQCLVAVQSTHAFMAAGNAGG